MKKITATPTNDKGSAHGQWEVYRDNGNLIYKCTFDNGVMVGYDEIHFPPTSDGTSRCKKTYIIR